MSFKDLDAFVNVGQIVFARDGLPICGQIQDRLFLFLEV